jgi:hypothetical protein
MSAHSITGSLELQPHGVSGPQDPKPKQRELNCPAQHQCDSTHSGNCTYLIDHGGSHHCSNCGKDF